MQAAARIIAAALADSRLAGLAASLPAARDTALDTGDPAALQRLAQAALAQLDRPPAPAEPALRSGAPLRKVSVIKVDQARIDMLMKLAGELIVAKNALPFLAAPGRGCARQPRPSRARSRGSTTP